MVRAMCNAKLVDKRSTADGHVGIEAADKLTRTNGVRWYGHVLR